MKGDRAVPPRRRYHLRVRNGTEASWRIPLLGGIGGAAVVAGLLALAEAAGAASRTPGQFLRPAGVLSIFSLTFLGYIAAGVPLGIAAALLANRFLAAARGRLGALLAVVVSVLLSAAAVLDATLSPDGTSLRLGSQVAVKGVVGIAAAVGTGAALAGLLASPLRARLTAASAPLLPLGAAALAVFVELRAHTPGKRAQVIAAVLLLCAVALLTASIAGLFAALAARGRRALATLLVAAFCALLASPIALGGRDGPAAAEASAPCPTPADPGSLMRPPWPQNIILISIDTLRADGLSCYGVHGSISPAIDRVAADGARFEHTYSTSSWTLPAHASMLTGLYPASHGADRSPQQTTARRIDPLAPSVPTLAEALRCRGYRTAGFVSNVFVTSAFGMHRGFETFHDRMDALDSFLSLKQSLFWRAMLFLGVWTVRDFDAEVKADESLPGQLRWIEEHAGDPFFLFLHFNEPHYIYEPPERFRRGPDGKPVPIFRDIERLLPGTFSLPPARIRELTTLYNGETANLDALLSSLFSLLDRLRLSGRTLLIITSDHGESLGEHGLWTHGDSLYEEQVRVPLIMRFPGVIPPGTTVREGPISLVDLVPTVLDLAGCQPIEGLPGQSLRPLWEGDGGGAPRAVYAELRPDSGWKSLNPAMGSGMKMVRTAGAKLILHPDGRRELYLADDTREERNVAADYPDLTREMELALKAWGESTRPAGHAPDLSLDAGTLEQLRTLGYIR